MVARKEALGPQPDDAAAFRTTISADAKRLIKAVENHLHEIMKPYPWMPASGAIVGPRPGIIAAVFGNLVEIQQERRYHGITFGGGGSPASGFVDGGCWRTHRPVFFKIKKDPCSQGPLNLKFSACLSTDSENYPLPPNTLLWDATRVPGRFLQRVTRARQNQTQPQSITNFTLADSLMRCGQLLPIVVVAASASGFVLIDGYQRVAAARRAGLCPGGPVSVFGQRQF